MIINRAPMPIVRNWETYYVKAVWPEPVPSGPEPAWPEIPDEQIAAYKSSMQNGWECQLHVLPTPIVVSDGLVDIITVTESGKEVRFYPPFALNEQTERSAIVSDIKFPVGVSVAERMTEIPVHAVRGVHNSHTPLPGNSWCRGLRADVQAGADIHKAIRLLLDHICQYTNQWWLQGTHNPFYGTKRFCAFVDTKFTPLEMLEYKGVKQVESPWGGATEFQPLGVVAPLSNEVWLLCRDHIARQLPADVGILAFRDAYSEYMAGRDEKCILNLCIGVEIVLCKHRQSILKNSSYEDLGKMLKKTRLVDEGIRADLASLMIDRNHVAHGRAPHILATKEGYTIERYIRAAERLLAAYVACIPSGEWPTVMADSPQRMRR